MLLRCRPLGRARHFSAHGGGDRRGYIVATARLQLVLFVLLAFYILKWCMLIDMCKANVQQVDCSIGLVMYLKTKHSNLHTLHFNGHFSR